jgi:transposase-like protein
MNITESATTANRKPMNEARRAGAEAMLDLRTQEAIDVGKHKGHSPQQVATTLQQYTTGTPVSVICARMGISRSTLYRWRAAAATERGGSLAHENRSLRRRVNALEVDKTLLQEILRRDRGSK